MVYIVIVYKRTYAENQIMYFNFNIINFIQINGSNPHRVYNL